MIEREGAVQRGTMLTLVTGAAGNLGSLLTEYLLKNTRLRLNLLIHKKNVPAGIRGSDRVTIFRGDLGQKATLKEPLRGVDVVVHFAGILFKNDPEKFLPVTNVSYFKNLCDTAMEQGVRRMILISFPHVEGETTKDKPAVGRLDGIPDSVHARTRLEEERYLFGFQGIDGFEPVSLRVGMVYGKGILMVDAARWLAERRLLGVWRKPTWIHLISKDDFLEATRAAVESEGIKGIYHAGDDGYQTLQEFLDQAATVWGCRKPWRMPESLIYLAASICELQSRFLGTRSPLTRDFVKIGMQSYYGDTSGMKRALLPCLKYPTLREGKEAL
ncbi:MAG: NAD-dependent epimerase/dehydratase family protein [Pseudomonadota bacterium]